MNVNSAIFISDFHLEAKNSEQYNKVFNFLNSLIGQVDHLFLLGDIFDFWYNDQPSLIKQYSEVLDLFEKISSSGTTLYFFEGNHDICYGHYVRERLNSKVFRKSTVIKINNFNVLMGHGDDLIKNNLKYRFFRAFLRLHVVKIIINLAPSSFVLKTAHSFSKFSRFLGKFNKYDINEEFKKIAREKFNENIDVLIVGHSHIPDATIIDNGKYFNCGNWIEDSSYVQFKNNTFTLKRLFEK